MILRCLPLLFIVVLFIGLSGCTSHESGDMVTVRGQLVNNGQIINPKPDDIVEIALYPVDAARPGLFGAAAEYNASNGTFVFHGPTDQGIMPAEYKVLLSWSPYDVGTSADRFQGKFSVNHSSLRYTVTNAREQEILIDVGKRTVTFKS